MTRLRLLPVLLFGLVSLFTLKVLTIAFDGTSSGRFAQFGFGDGPSSGEQFARAITKAREGVREEPIITGSVGNKPGEAAKETPKEPAKDAAKGPEAGKPGALPEPAGAIDAKAPKFKPEPEGVRILPPNGKPVPGENPAERAVLEKLRERREALEARDRELELREGLLRTTERKLDERIGQLRTAEGQGGAEGAKAEAKTRYKPLVVMYESMKPKEAARVFDRLDTRVLLDLVAHMNPRKMSEILAAMEPGAAERLTLALARQAAAGPASEAPQPAAMELPRLPVPGR